MALAAGVALVVAGSSTASAQSTQQDYVTRGMVNGSYYHGSGSGYSAPAYNYQYPSAPAPTYTAYYAPEPVVPRSAALVRLGVPANAEVFFSGEKTQQRGESRSFVTPPLESGKKYVYHIKVRWTDSKGKAVEREERVRVHPDDRLHFDFE